MFKEFFFVNFYLPLASWFAPMYRLFPFLNTIDRIFSLNFVKDNNKALIGADSRVTCSVKAFSSIPRGQNLIWWRDSPP